MESSGDAGPTRSSATDSQAQAQAQRTTSVTRPQQKRNPRPRKNLSQSAFGMDGSVSDSVANTGAGGRPKHEYRQRQQSAGLDIGPGEYGKTKDHKAGVAKQRPVSISGTLQPASPFKEQAYAGPTFQASPAASSLPKPKFFSKSVPNVAGAPTTGSRLAGEVTPEKGSASPEPQPAMTEPPALGMQSPLDMFFKADKAEKERSRSSSMLSPEMAARPAPSDTEPRNLSQQSGKSIFLQELDGDRPDLLSPKTLPKDKAQPSSLRAKSSDGVRRAETDGENERMAQTQALKNLLFQDAHSPSSSRGPTPPHPHSQFQSPRRTSNVPIQTPSPLQRSTSGPSTPAPFAEYQNQYSLQYGNRNLNQLFQAARKEMPARPSGLRQQEIPDEANGRIDSSVDAGPEARKPSHQAGPSDFSQPYLDQQARASQPDPAPSQLPFTNGIHSSSSSAFPGPPARPANGVPVGSGPPPTNNMNTSNASPRTRGDSRDIRAMEDDLRRMLKLNVLSN